MFCSCIFPPIIATSGSINVYHLICKLIGRISSISFCSLSIYLDSDSKNKFVPATATVYRFYRQLCQLPFNRTGWRPSQKHAQEALAAVATATDRNTKCCNKVLITDSHPGQRRLSLTGVRVESIRNSCVDPFPGILAKCCQLKLISGVLIFFFSPKHHTIQRWPASSQQLIHSYVH